MPELPEAETIVRGLRPRVTGRRIVAVDFLARRVATRATRAAMRRYALGRAILEVGRRAKIVLLHLEGGALLAFQLRMTGRVVWLAAGRGEHGLDLDHRRAVIQLDDGSRILFDDVRQFGSVTLFTPESWRRYAARLGPEPLGPEFTPEHLAGSLARATRATVKAVLLDPRCAAGVGNVYANEACFLAGIRPSRRARRLREEEVACLHGAVRQVLLEAIEARGTTLRDYRDAAGDLGSYQDRLRVYGREGEACVRCGGRIRRIVIAGRATFFCPRCQR